MVHAGDGGFVLAKDRKCGSRLLSLTNHGFTKSYHFVHFESAMNAKMNGLGAALACGCLDQVEWIIEHRSMVRYKFVINKSH
jgi:dTDP-4-amino-4,6-dideoxygalactose transaminase